VRALFLLALASLTAQADDHRGRFERFCSRTDQGRTNRGFLCDSYAFFEAFPASGAGTFGACSTTPPTAAKGEVLTFTRASNGTCTKTATGGLATTGIADGDLVVLSSNQPRVEYDSGGVLGLLVEASRTNSILRSQEIDNVAWGSNASGVAGPTLNGANAATAPDGTVTAEDYSFPAVASTQYSLRSQSAACPASSSVTVTIFVKGVSSADTVRQCLETSTGVFSCSGPCASATGSWTRCSFSATTGVGGGKYYVGNGDINAGVSNAATRLYLWGAQCEAGAYATSYIPTGAGTATRVVESAAFNTPLPAGNVGSIAASVNSVWSSNTNGSGFPLAVASSTSATTAGPDLLFLNSPGSNGTTWRCIAGNAAGGLFNTPDVALGSGPQRRGWCESGATVTGEWNGTAMTASAATSGTFNAGAYLHVGQIGGGYQIDGIVSRICRDPSPSRCR